MPVTPDSPRGRGAAGRAGPGRSRRPPAGTNMAGGVQHRGQRPEEAPPPRQLPAGPRRVRGPRPPCAADRHTGPPGSALKGKMVPLETTSRPSALLGASLGALPVRSAIALRVRGFSCDSNKTLPRRYKKRKRRNRYFNHLGFKIHFRAGMRSKHCL